MMQKYFCIGFNKTGTTSVKRAFQDLGIVVGDQATAESLFRHCREGDWEPLIAYCQTAQAFQDVPFSLTDTFPHLDRAFPGSKFILTVRDSPEQWYTSVVSFHSKIFGKGRIPTKADLQNATYRRPGWIGELLSALPEQDPYNRELWISFYKMHNEVILSYFSTRPDDLLVLNVSEPNAYGEFCSFLGIPPRDP